MLDAESQLFLRLLRGAPLPESVTSKSINWRQFLYRASGGRVLFEVARCLTHELPCLIPPELKPILNDILEEGNRRLDQLRQTVQHIDDCLNPNIAYLVVKTARPVPYVTFDVDVLVRPEDYDEASARLITSGGSVQPYAPKQQSDILIPGLLRIDLHRNFHWQGSTFVDQDFLWQHATHSFIEGFICPTPSQTVEWTLIGLNVLYERTYLPWLDYLALSDSAARIDGPLVYTQARQYGWLQGLNFLCEMVEQVNTASDLAWLQGANGPLVNLNGGSHENAAYVRLPLSFSFASISRLFLERWNQRGTVCWYDLAYAVFSKTRYHFANEELFPIYGHWFDLSRVQG